MEDQLNLVEVAFHSLARHIGFEQSCFLRSGSVSALTVKSVSMFQTLCGGGTVWIQLFKSPSESFIHSCKIVFFGRRSLQRHRKQLRPLPFLSEVSQKFCCSIVWLLYSQITSRLKMLMIHRFILMHPCEASLPSRLHVGRSLWAGIPLRIGPFVYWWKATHSMLPLLCLFFPPLPRLKSYLDSCLTVKLTVELHWHSPTETKLVFSWSCWQ